MEKRRTTTTGSEDPGHRQGAAPARLGAAYLVHFVLGAVLIAAGVLKLYHLASEAQDEGLGTLLLMLYAEAELLGGIWLIAGLDLARTHPWAVAAFAGLAAASLFRGLAGNCSCGCFGVLTTNPWAVLVLDLAAVAALLAWRPSADTESTLLDHPARLAGWALLAIGIGIVGWRLADSVALAGTATRGGNALAEATLTFTGESAKVEIRTDPDGRFRVPLPGLGRYAVALSGAPEAQASARSPSAGRAEKKAAGRSKLRPAMAPMDATRRLSWVEVSGCSEEERAIDFQ